MEPARRSIVHSPWYWVYLFATAGLIALVLIGPKFGERQSQLERNYQGRVRANQHAQGVTPHGEISSPDDTMISLTPLYLGLGLVIMIAWAILWYSHFRQGKRAASTPSGGSS